jgi:hypothetical protein
MNHPKLFFDDVCFLDSRSGQLINRSPSLNRDDLLTIIELPLYVIIQYNTVRDADDDR